MTSPCMQRITTPACLPFSVCPRKSNRSFSPVESVFDKWPPCLPGRPPYQPFNINPGTFAPVCDIQPWFPREMKTIESRCQTSYQSKMTKYFRYFGQSQIVADTGPEGEGRALVENLTITGVVKAGRGSVKGLPADYLSEQPIN